MVINVNLASRPNFYFLLAPAIGHKLLLLAVLFGLVPRSTLNTSHLRSYSIYLRANFYFQLIRAHNVRTQDVVSRIQRRQLYIAPHVQESLTHLDPVSDERLATWCIGLREALSGRRAFPRYPVVKPARQEAGPLELSSNPVGGGSRDERNDKGKHGRLSSRRR